LNNSDGVKNTALGYQALLQSTGSRNIAVGHLAGMNLFSGNNNIYFAHDGGNNESLTTRVGTPQTRAFIAGIAATAVNGASVMVNGGGQVGVVLSSARYKRDIIPLVVRSTRVHELRPVAFAYREDAPGAQHYGLIAEEVATVFPELVTRTVTDEVQTARYHALIPLLLDELQRQEADLQRQQEAFERHQQELDELRILVERQPGRTADPAAFPDLLGTIVRERTENLPGMR
jgi:hypothetical protein